MKAIAAKVALIIALVAGVINSSIVIKSLLTNMIANASSPDAIKQHQQEVLNRCLQVSGLRNPQTVSSIITFGDEVGYDALMVRGNYPQPHMNNEMGNPSACSTGARNKHTAAMPANPIAIQVTALDSSLTILLVLFWNPNHHRVKELIALLNGLISGLSGITTALNPVLLQPNSLPMSVLLCSKIPNGCH